MKRRLEQEGGMTAAEVRRQHCMGEQKLPDQGSVAEQETPSQGLHG